MAFVALVERDDQRGLPTFIGQTVEAHRIAGFVKAGDLKREAEKVFGFVHGECAEDRVVAIVVGHKDDQGQLE